MTKARGLERLHELGHDLGWMSLTLLTCSPGPASFHSARKNYLGRLLDLG
jgi:hypothetical protein